MDAEVAKVKKVIVALDESEQSFHALQWALDYVLRPGDTVLLLHSQDEPPDSMTGPSPVLGANVGAPLSANHLRGFKKHQNEVTSRILNAAQERCQGRGLQVESVVREGDARTTICTAVSKLKANVLVMGSHGYNTIKRVLLGSVSDYCAHHVKCPVLIVKKQEHSS